MPWKTIFKQIFTDEICVPFMHESLMLIMKALFFPKQLQKKQRIEAFVDFFFFLEQALIQKREKYLLL